MSDTAAPPAPAVAETPPAAPPAPTPAPATEQPAAAAEPREQRTRAPRRRGMPVEPLVIAAGNGTTMTATAAYQAGGTAGLVGTAAAFGAVSLVAIARRRNTVKARRSTTAAGRTRSAAPNRGRSGSGALRSGGSGTGAGRAGAGKRSGAGRGGALRSALGAAGRRSRSNAPGSGAPSPKRSPKHARSGAPKKTRPGRDLAARVRPGSSAARRGTPGSERTRGPLSRAARSVARSAAVPARLVRAAAKRTEGVRASAARHAGRAGRALWDGLLSGAAGVASAAWNRSARAGLATMRAVWAKRRRNRAAKATKRGPAMTGPEAASTPPPIAPYVRRPAFAGGTSSNAGGTVNAGGHHFLGPAMEMHRIAATYTPDGMMQVGRDFGGLAESLEHIANALKVTTARADAEQPLDTRIVGIMQQIYGLQIKAAELAQELKPAFLSCHRVDIDRLQQQRPNEREWDVTRNADVSL